MSKKGKFSNGLGPFVMLTGIIVSTIGIIKATFGYFPLINSVSSGDIIAIGIALVLVGVVGRLVSLGVIIWLLFFYLIPFFNGELTELDKQAIDIGLFFAIISWILGTKLGKRKRGSSILNGKKACSSCNGTGQFITQSYGVISGETTPEPRACYTCDGTGYVS